MSLSNPAQPAQFEPADHGLIAWTYDPVVAMNGLIVQTAGRQHTVRLKVKQPATVTAIKMLMSVAGATLTAGQNFAMLHDETGARVGITADMSTLWAGAIGELDMPLTAPVQINGPVCWVSFYANGSTLPTFRLTTPATGVLGNVGLATAASRFGLSASGLTSTPPTVLGTIANTSFPYWVGLR